MPCSAEFFVRHSQLLGRAQDGTVHKLVPLGSLTVPGLLRLQSQLGDQCHLWMDLDPKARKGASVNDLPDIPVYACAKAVVSSPSFDQIEALEITYITLFAYNGPYTIIPGLLSTGAHDGDIEHITIRVDPTSGDLIAVWYNAHRSRDGEWVPGDCVPRTRKGRIIAYVALHGHGHYPRTGTILRHFFLGNDKCSEHGPVWTPRRVVLLPTHAVREQIAPKPLSVNYTLDDLGDCLPNAVLPGYMTLPRAVTRGFVFQNSMGIGTCRNCGVCVDGLKEVDERCDVVADDSCEWIFFEGDWGDTAAPRMQGWFHSAETPVSRTTLQRLFFHFWPETRSVQ